VGDAGTPGFGAGTPGFAGGCPLPGVSGLAVGAGPFAGVCGRSGAVWPVTGLLTGVFAGGKGTPGLGAAAGGAPGGAAGFFGRFASFGVDMIGFSLESQRGER
jgi:hypothetical protein